MPNMPTAPDRSSFPDTRAWIRALPALSGATPAPVDTLPDSPTALFLDWIEQAAEAGVPEPHAAALSTVDADGNPDARFLLLKDVTEQGFWFSGDTRSPKDMTWPRIPLPHCHSTGASRAGRCGCVAP